MVNIFKLSLSLSALLIVTSPVLSMNTTIKKSDEYTQKLEAAIKKWTDSITHQQKKENLVNENDLETFRYILFNLNEGKERLKLDYSLYTEKDKIINLTYLAQNLKSSLTSLLPYLEKSYPAENDNQVNIVNTYKKNEIIPEIDPLVSELEKLCK